MRSNWRSLSVLSMAVLLLVSACGGAPGGAAKASGGGAAPAATGSPAAAPSQGSRVLRIALTAPANNISSKEIKAWGDEVTKLTHGKLRFRYYWGGSLLSATATFDGVSSGATDLGYVPSSYITGEVPAVSVLEVPYAFPIMSDHFVQFADAVNPILDKVYQQHGQKLIFTVTAQLPLAIAGRSRFYTTMNDFHGALIRTAGKWQAATMREWGAKPVVIGIGNLYTALQRGTVDSTLLIYDLIDSFKIYEVAKYLTPLDSSINYVTIDMNLNEWKQLSAAEQQAMLKAGHQAEVLGIQMVQKASKSGLSTLKAKGMKVSQPSPQVLDQLRQKAELVWKQIAKVQGPEGDQVMAVVRKFQKYVVVK